MREMLFRLFISWRRLHSLDLLYLHLDGLRGGED